MELLTIDSSEGFRRYLETTGRSRNTAKAYDSDLRALLRWSRRAEIPGGELKGVAVDWFNGDTAAPSTLSRRKAAINRFAVWAGGPNPLITEDVYRLPPPTPPTPHPLATGMDGVAEMLRHANGPNQYMLIYLCGRLGLRVSEAVSVMWSDWDADTNTLTVLGKGSKVRRIPLKDDTVANRRGQNGSDLMVDLANSTARREVTQIAKRAGLVGVASHDLRATFATDIYRRTKDIRIVQLLLGHASVVTTQRYVGVDVDDMRAAMP